ncbi:putative cyclase [Kalmanozyma brasiliensis GHG001]|uniref:Cyclase n=1 Tax=Kalmanozyma brasiliensis (strain GHG001) TaxID=1365824 RepID=V5EC50_KALBG|nr:putative cyclase [Kalmanozyma brasiliensis GHG001]EST08011.1 putative cyclase [Kalmanozyma brasiliensis GHG001]
MVDSDSKAGPKPASPENNSQDQDRTHAEDESNRQRIASIASRFGGFAAQASTQAASKGAEVAAEAGEQVAKTVNTTRHAAATQAAGLFQAMALTTKNVSSDKNQGDGSSGKAWYEYESPLHARRRIAEYESPLQARRRLAAIASQLGLATSSAKQAPSLLSGLTSAPRHHPTSSSSNSSEKWDTATLPDYRELPAEGGWPGCAWDVWGRGDQLGTINLLTESVVLRAAKENIKTGRTVSLNWPVHLPAEPFFRRKALTHRPFGKGGPGYTEPRDAFIAGVKAKQPDVLVRDDPDSKVPVSDEMLELNTQSGSQWDSCRHFGHLPLNVFYGGASRASIQDTFDDTSPQPADPQSWNTEEAQKRNALGIQHLAQHGICGRGVLLDVFEYLSHHGTGDVERNYQWSSWSGYGGGKGYDPRTGFRITVADLVATAKHQHVQLRHGDILLIRSGFTARYYSLSPQERADWSSPEGGMPFAGVEQGEEMKEFMWNNHFAAVAGDSPAFEARPMKEGECMLHETFLAMWGMPIGELFDLEGLAETCRELKRYEFYFSSWPLNLFGGVASCANAAATF